MNALRPKIRSVQFDWNSQSCTLRGIGKGRKHPSESIIQWIIEPISGAPKLYVDTDRGAYPLPIPDMPLESVHALALELAQLTRRPVVTFPPSQADEFVRKLTQ